jgi:anhydro-N-acetylmuramic acid kinase
MKDDAQLYIGLMSGTSLDGIDAALVRIAEGDAEPEVSTLATAQLDYGRDERDFLQRLCEDFITSADICLAESFLALRHAEAVLAVLEEAGISRDTVRAIGFHGQTAHHQPDAIERFGLRLRGTLQLGDAALLAHETGIGVVSQFRLQDMALGGQGAPLVPAFDYALLNQAGEGRIICNIGGIANVTFLPASAEKEKIRAFDTGPGNCLINAAVSRITGGRHSFDKDGELAAEGDVDSILLQRLLEEAYYARRTPKSTGREYFNAAYLETVLVDFPDIADADLVATLTQLTATTIADAVAENWAYEQLPQRLIVSGGGARNPVLMQMLERSLNGVSVETSGSYGINPDFKEAIAFAWLAHAYLEYKPGNMPAATGADVETICGSFTPAPRP